MRGLPGGAQEAAVGTTPVAIDLTALAWREVMIWSDDDDLLFSFAASATSPTLSTYSATVAASDSAPVAGRAGKGWAVKRTIDGAYPFLIAAHVTLTGVVRVKPVTVNGEKV